MTAPAAAGRPVADRLTLGGRLRVARRAVTAVAWLALCLVLYGIRALLPGRSGVPRLFLHGALRIAGARLAIVGERACAPSFLIANHVSWIDILALSAATGTAFVAHDGLAAHKLLRFLCRLNRTVFIARSARASVVGQIAQVQEGLHESGILTLFPEGTTGDGITMAPFKSSLLAAIVASESGVAIRPVWIDYGAQAPEIAWCGDEPGLANAIRLAARRRPLTFTVHLLPALTAAQRQDRKAIATAARAAIATQADQRVAL